MENTNGERFQRILTGVVPDPIWRHRPETLPLTRRMTALGVPGVSVAVFENGEIAWTAGFGERQAGAPVTAKTLFQAGSISKPTTALGAMRLVEDGALDLDEDINSYLRTWKVPATGDWQPRVTLRQLLSHSAGLTVHGFSGYNRRAPRPTVPQILNGEPPANTRPVRVNIIPGTQFRYSGGGTTIVQQMIEDVTGLRFPVFMENTVLGPLGMEHSTFEQPLPRHRWGEAASGHRAGGGLVVGKWHVYPEMAAAGLWTTPSDLCRMLIDVQRAWAGGAGTLLRHETVREMLTPQAAEFMGIGFFLEGIPGAPRFGHSGSDEGFICTATSYRDNGRGAAVMTNGDWGGILCPEIMRGIAREHGWPHFSVALPEPVEAAPDSLQDLVGTYRLRPTMHLNVTVEDGCLFLQPDGQSPIRLYAAGETTFFSDVVNSDVEFRRDADGTVTELTLRQGDSSVSASRVDPQAV